MTKREYAQEIADIINGEVTEIRKNNGVIKTGIQRKEEGHNVSAIIYIDDMYDEGVDIDEAAEKIDELLKENSHPDLSVEVDDLTNYESMKGKLTLQLFNERNAYEVKVSAKEYGFDDLIIVPVVVLGRTANGMMSFKVTNEILKKWGVSAEQVFADAEAQISRDDYTLVSMAKIMAEMMGMDVENIPDNGMMVVTNREKCNGAYGIIALREQLRQKFPDGYIVIPSSIHECIVHPLIDTMDIDSWVNEVNDSCVDDTEVLGHKAYRIM